MKTLFVVPEIRLDSAPFNFPFWAGILAAIVKKKKGQVGILDLNALRARYNGKQVPDKIIEEEVASEKVGSNRHWWFNLYIFKNQRTNSFNQKKFSKLYFDRWWRLEYL